MVLLKDLFSYAQLLLNPFLSELLAYLALQQLKFAFVLWLHNISFIMKLVRFEQQSLQFEVIMSHRSTSVTSSPLTISNFAIKEQVGSGKFGIVYRAVEKYSQRQVAIKIIHKKTINNAALHKQLQRQIQIHSKLKHPFICELYAYFHDTHSIYIVLQYCPHGSLATPIQQTKQVFSDKKIASIFLQIAQAIAYMHQRNVMHRDLKLQNILLDQFFNAKISDFGWCIHQSLQRHTFCGTMEYICPQMLRKQKYSHSIDIYCLGIILYEMYYFKSPFLGKSEQQTFLKIKQGSLSFQDSIRKIPEEAKDLMKDLLNKDSGQRPKATSIVEHQFIQRYLLDAEDKIQKKQRITQKEFKKWRESLNYDADIAEI